MSRKSIKPKSDQLSKAELLTKSRVHAPCSIGGEQQLRGDTSSRFEAYNLAYSKYGGILPAALISRTIESIVDISSSQDYSAMVSQHLDPILAQYEQLEDRVVEAAKQAFPAEDAAGLMDEAMIFSVMDDVVALYINLICSDRSHLDLDLFTDIMWPATKLRLAVALQTTVSIDARKLEAWCRLHGAPTTPLRY